MYLEQTCAAGKHLITQARPAEVGYHWQAPDGFIYHSFAHGTTGIALFLLYLYHYTKNQVYVDYAIVGMEYEISQAITADTYIVWYRSDSPL
ncbi:MAG: hypothetical protein GFH25_541210n31 [Chloroflexi bacterium AL-N10]|nr:hypothetical protein [Chloroflexi bacterium AL-N1]NOK69604.1 hypothetical protein [Chloroflexi bacterium AL-N10]NOK72151.1 hypothetical protein [Chloroflexi bacterium AL-N5]